VKKSQQLQVTAQLDLRISLGLSASAQKLGDGRHQNPGAKPILDDVQQANLLQALRGPAADAGLWNGPKVADYLSELIGQPSAVNRVGYLKQMRLRLRVPRQSHQEADTEERGLEKKLTQELKRIQAEYPDADVEVWCEDEHRVAYNQ
jgi:hypothetical protein